MVKFSHVGTFFVGESLDKDGDLEVWMKLPDTYGGCDEVNAYLTEENAKYLIQHLKTVFNMDDDS